MTDVNNASEGGIPALRKQKVDGTPYVRPSDIEGLLRVLVKIDEDDALARARIRRRSAPGWLPGECLIHMLRRAGRRRDQRSYNKWCALILERVRAGLPRADGEAVAARTIELTDYALDRFVGMLGPDLAGYDERLDIWEARFDLALANLRRDAFRRHASGDEVGEVISLGDDAALAAEVERARGAFDPFDPARDAEDDFRSRVWTAINALPTEQNRILTMMREEMPVGTGAAGEISMSGVLNRTPRTILNYKLKAIAAVRRAVLGDEL